MEFANGAYIHKKLETLRRPHELPEDFRLISFASFTLRMLVILREIHIIRVLLIGPNLPKTQLTNLKGKSRETKLSESIGLGYVISKTPAVFVNIEGSLNNKEILSIENPLSKICVENIVC